MDAVWQVLIRHDQVLTTGKWLRPAIKYCAQQPSHLLDHATARLGNAHIFPTCLRNNKMTGVGIPQENWRINEIYSCEKYQTNSNYCCGVFQIAICAYQRAVFFLGGKGRRPAVHEVWKSFSRTSASMLMGRFLTGCMRKFRRLTESRFRLSSMVDSMIESLLSRTKLGTPCFNPQVESRCKHSNS